MTQEPLIESLNGIIRPLAESLGVDLWGIELAFSGRGLLRIYIEAKPTGTPPADELPDETTEQDVPSAQGVSIEQCAELSRLVGLTLDVEDIMPGAYVLEVSSPGLERVFFTAEQLATAAGKTVDITLVLPSGEFQNRRKFRGVLESVPTISHDNSADEEQFFTLSVPDAAKPGEDAPTLRFSWTEVKKAKLVHIVPEKSLPGKGPGKKAKKQ